MRHQESKTRSIPHWLAIVAAVGALLMTTAFVSAGAPATSAPAATEKKENVTEPKLISKVSPVYPESARQNRTEGLIVVETTISVKGDVTSVSVAKGIEGEDGKALAEAALAAVKQWKFEPAKKDGKPVEVNYAVTINFKLDHGKEKK